MNDVDHAIAKKLNDYYLPNNTCSASRHASDIGEAMINHSDDLSVMIDNFQYAGASILYTVAALWEARSRLQSACDLLDGLNDDDLSAMTGIAVDRCNILLRQIRGE